MIFIVFTVWLVTATIVRIRRGITYKQCLYLFTIILCAGIILRSILLVFGM